MHESSTKRTRLKWVEDRNTLVDLDRLVTRHTLSARRPLLDIVINILKPEASSWATMTQLVRGPDCRAPFPPLLPPCTPVITFLCLLSRPARRSQRKKHGDRSAANIHLLSSNTCCFWPPIVIHLVAANRLPLNQTRPSVRDSAAQLANTWPTHDDVAR